MLYYYYFPHNFKILSVTPLAHRVRSSYTARLLNIAANWPAYEIAEHNLRTNMHFHSFVITAVFVCLFPNIFFVSSKCLCVIYSVHRRLFQMRVEFSWNQIKIISNCQRNNIELKNPVKINLDFSVTSLNPIVENYFTSDDRFVSVSAVMRFTSLFD